MKYSLATISSDLKPNIIYLDGTWKNNADSMELQSETGRIALVYSANQKMDQCFKGNRMEQICQKKANLQ